MLSLEELDKWINLADECMPTYSARRDVQAALMIAIAQLQVARIATEEHESRQRLQKMQNGMTALPEPLLGSYGPSPSGGQCKPINWTPESRQAQQSRQPARPIGENLDDRL